MTAFCIMSRDMMHAASMQSLIIAGSYGTSLRRLQQDGECESRFDLPVSRFLWGLRLGLGESRQGT